MGAKLLLAGYFGSGNLGDDAILLGFLRGIDGLPYEVKAIGGSAERLMRNYGVRGMARTDINHINRAIEECDALVFPGGSIFQDVTSVRSAAYYANLVKAAKKNKKKVIMLAQGVGPLNRWLGKKAASTAFNMADMITVRDPQSIKTLRELGVAHSPKVTGDCAFLLPEPELAHDSTSFGVAGMKAIGISCRPWGKDKNKLVINVFGELVRLLNSNGYVPVMMPLDDLDDSAVIQQIAKANGGKVPELKGITTPMQLQQRIMRMEGVIAMRLHAGILATTVGVPPYMISYDPKVAAFANIMGFSTPPSMQGLTADRVFNGFQSFIKDRERIVQAMAKKRDEQATLAMENINVLRNVLGE